MSKPKCKHCNLALMKGPKVEEKCSGCEVYERMKKMVGEDFFKEHAMIEGLITIGYGSSRIAEVYEELKLRKEISECLTQIIRHHI